MELSSPVLKSVVRMKFFVSFMKCSTTKIWSYTILYVTVIFEGLLFLRWQLGKDFSRLTLLYSSYLMYPDKEKLHRQ